MYAPPWRWPPSTPAQSCASQWWNTSDDTAASGSAMRPSVRRTHCAWPANRSCTLATRASLTRPSCQVDAIVGRRGQNRRASTSSLGSARLPRYREARLEAPATHGGADPPQRTPTRGQPVPARESCGRVRTQPRGTVRDDGITGRMAHSYVSPTLRSAVARSAVRWSRKLGSYDLVQPSITCASSSGKHGRVSFQCGLRRVSESG